MALKSMTLNEIEDYLTKYISGEVTMTDDDENSIIYSLAARQYTMAEEYDYTTLDRLLCDLEFDCCWLDKNRTVLSDFEEGGRWYNLEVYVFEFKDVDKNVYVKRTRNVGATEMQDNGEVRFEIVERKQKMIYYYE